jgi:hypothetical protein
MTRKGIRLIAVSQENYLALKKLGMAGDSFNDVLTAIIKKVNPLQTDPRLSASNQFVVENRITQEGNPVHG